MPADEVTWSLDAARFNPNHAPAGAGGGEFTSASGAAQAHKEHQAHEAHLAHMRHLAASPVRQGEHGKRVSDLQDQLNALGAKPPLASDGIFGPKTLAAVKAFQRAHGLKPDGLVGPKTMAALQGAHAARKPKAVTAHHAVKPAHAARTAQTAEASTVHKPFGSPAGPGLFGMKGAQLPAYIQSVAHHLVEQGHDESRAIEMAVGIVENWKNGHDGHGNKVSAQVQAAAVKAMAEWEKLRAQAHADGKPAASRAAHAGRSGMSSAEYDADGLDGSWDDPGGLPDLTGLDVADFEACDPRAGAPASRAAKLGSGTRFAALKAALGAKGAADPGALAAHIGRRKYGKARFAALAGKARRHKGGGMARSELFRCYPLEDVHILTRAEGDGSGRVVEAYATVFDQPAEIHDGQGHYMEVIDRTAFDQVLARHAASPGGLRGSVKVLYNHGKTMEGVPAPEYQLPLGVPLEVRPEARGLLTRTEYDASDPFTDRILSKIRSGAITAQSFVGGIIRSTPELRGPGDRHRARNGSLTTVRRIALGLREYGPVLFPAYTGAEILGVRMSIPGSLDEPDYTEDEENAPGMEGDVTGGTPAEVHPSRMNAHRLWHNRLDEGCREAGIVLPGRG